MVEKDTIKALQERIESYEKVVQELRESIKTENPEISLIEQFMAVLKDPYDVKDPHKIHGEIPPDKEHEYGQVLRWLSPRVREKNGLQGWIPMEWGDKYVGPNGEELKKFLNDVPFRMKGPDQMDNYVRRGRMFLGRLPKEIWVSRQLKRELLSAQRVGALSSSQETVIREGLKIFGTGLQTDTEPHKKHDRTYEPFDKKTGRGSHRTELPVMEQEE